MANENEVITKEKKERKRLDTRKGSIFWTVWNIIEALLIFTGGILCLVYCDNKDLQQTILFIVGGFVIFDGVLRIIINFLPVLTLVEKAAMTYDLVISGSVELAIGITLVCDVAIESSAFDVLIKFISMFIGIALIVFGAVILFYSIALLTNRVIKMKTVSIIGLLVSALLITLGILTIVKLNDADKFAMFALIIAGIVLIVTGISQVVTAIFQRKKYLLKKEIKENIDEAKNQFEQAASSKAETDEHKEEQQDDNVLDAHIEETKDNSEDK